MAAKKKTARKKTVKPKARTSKTNPSSDVDALSICSACAKHPTLKRFVLNHGATGNECGICHRRDQIASAPAEHVALSSLVRALVRYFYDEWIYNGHWGGNEEPESLLSKENEIVEHAATRGFPRSAESSEPFLVGLFDDPYPDYDKGIAIYAGHDDEMGRLPPLPALSNSRSPLFEKPKVFMFEKCPGLPVCAEHQSNLSGLRALQESFLEFSAEIGHGGTEAAIFYGPPKNPLLIPVVGNKRVTDRQVHGSQEINCTSGPCSGIEFVAIIVSD